MVQGLWQSVTQV